MAAPDDETARRLVHDPAEDLLPESPDEPPVLPYRPRRQVAAELTDDRTSREDEISSGRRRSSGTGRAGGSA